MHIWTSIVDKLRFSLVVAIILVAAQLFTGFGFGTLTLNTAYAANEDVWWYEITYDNKGNAPVYRDQINKNLSNNFNNLFGSNYTVFGRNIGDNIIRFIGQLPVPITDDHTTYDEYQFYVSTNNHPSNTVQGDTVRLWVDQQLLIDTVGNPVIGEVPEAGKITLEEGQIYDIRIEVVIESGIKQSDLILSWIKPGSTQTNQIDLITAEPDLDPPSTVTDATYGTISSHSIELLWTAPGSDDIILEGPAGTELSWGTVSLYDIRYSTAAVGGDVEAWWEDAVPLDHGLTPQTSGSAQNLTVENLAEETTFHFAMRSKDASNNESAISNIVTGSTLAPDKTSPAVVLDLEVVYDEDEKGIVATWTAPGDDGNEGTATAYDLRYDVNPIITEDDWNQASVVSDLPVPAPAGTPQSAELELAWAQTYYFVQTTTDNEGNESEWSNLFEYTTPSLPIGIFSRIPLNPTMVYNEQFPHTDSSLSAGSKAMLDEQFIAGDPLNGMGGNPENAMSFGSAAFNQLEQFVVIDLGENYELEYIFPYYGVGYNTGEMEIFAGKPFQWNSIYHINGIPGNQWSEIDLRDQDIETRYLKFKIDPVDTRRGINELVLYGTRLGTGQDPTPPERADHTKPWMDEFIGINALRDDPLDAIAVAGNVREYHNWGLDVLGGGPTGTLDEDFEFAYPNNKTSWNPSNCCGGVMNYDEFFKSVHDLGITLSPAIQGSVSWLSKEHGDKPVWPFGADPTKPESYIAHADHMFQFVARYGSKEVDESLLKLAEGQPVESGLGYIEYFENGNETNAHWATREIHMTPHEFAAMLSATMDT